jgi:nucleotide-binding universal stress UspA family protein
MMLNRRSGDRHLRNSPNSFQQDLDCAVTRHGVKVVTVKFSANDGNLADKLQAEALRGGTDILVLGLYSLSRLGKLSLGGVTKDILATSHMRIMFSH